MKSLILILISLFFISSSYGHQEDNKHEKQNVTYENHYHKSYKNFKK